MYDFREKKPTEQLLSIVRYLLGTEIYSLSITLPRGIIASRPLAFNLIGKSITFLTTSRHKDIPNHLILIITKDGDDYVKLHENNFAKNLDALGREPISFNINIEDIGFIKYFLENIITHDLNVKTI